MKNSGKPDGNHSAVKAGKSSKSTASNRGNHTDRSTSVGSQSKPSASKWKGDLKATWKGLPSSSPGGVDIDTDVG